MPSHQTITWLHLSDWHQGDPNFDRKIVCERLIGDIRGRAAIDDTLEKVDFVIFSGDLAYYGLPNEYIEAQTCLLDPVLHELGLEHNKLFLVPGNHDLDRKTVYDMAPKALQKALETDAAVHTWLTDNDKRERLLEPFRAYRKFVSDYTRQPTPDYASIVRTNVGDIKIALLGLNSALMSGRYKNKQRVVDDARRLVVGEPQIHDALEQIADAGVRIAVLHHPFDWLAPFDRARVQAQLGRGCDFILQGHEHTPKVQVVNSTEGNYVLIPTGASFERRQAESSHYTNAYNWVHLDPTAGHGMVYLRRWSDPRTAWIDDTDAYPGGKFEFRSFPEPVIPPLALASRREQIVIAILPDPMILTLAPGITMSLVRVSAGEFTMGSKDGDPDVQPDEKPPHPVTLDEYLIGKYPVTVSQFRAFVQASGYKADSRALREGKDDHPVNYVSWDDASAFCLWASRVTGRTVRLLTEAEWEKAARGTDGRIYPWGNAEPDSSRCNFAVNVKDTTPVGQYSSTGDSPYGCADMAGNVWEWVNDRYVDDYYSISPASNPPGPTAGRFRVLRGGGWGNSAVNLRSATRYAYSPVSRGSNFGFRCAVSPGI